MGGKPRFLGLILTVILLFCLAGVAAWATLSEGGFARLFEGPEAATSLEAAPDLAAAPVVAGGVQPGPIAPEVAADQTAPALAEDLAPAGDLAVTEDESLAQDGALAQDRVLGEDGALAEGMAGADPGSEAAAQGEVLSPAAADRFYAATGVWLRAPRLPLLPQSEQLQSIPEAVAVAPVAQATLSALPPSGQLAPDSSLATQPSPPQPDARFARDARGLFVATPEGTVTPDGLIIFAGSPSVVPPTRPAPAVADPAEAAEADGAVPDQAALAAAAVPDTPVSPQARPEDVASTAGAVGLDGLRPPVRPEDLVVPDQPDAEVLASFAGPRPPTRPQDLAPEPAPEPAAEAAPEEEPAEPEPQAPEAVDVETALAAIVAAGPDPLATATPQAVARATRPDARPGNFDRVVAQAQARATRAQPANAGGIAPTALAPSGGTEPERVSAAAAAPTGPAPSSVASAATIDDAINLRSINLIGVYGRPNDRRALVRLGNGRYVRVGIGDRLDGGQVNAIGDNALNYVKNGRTLTLQIPSG